MIYLRLPPLATVLLYWREAVVGEIRGLAGAREVSSREAARRRFLFAKLAH